MNSPLSLGLAPDSVDFSGVWRKVGASLSALSQGCICYGAIDTRGVPVLAGDLQYTIIITLLDNVLTAASITAPSNESSKIDCRLTVSQPAGGPFFLVSLTNGIDSRRGSRVAHALHALLQTSGIRRRTSLHYMASGDEESPSRSRSRLTSNRRLFLHGQQHFTHRNRRWRYLDMQDATWIAFLCPFSSSACVTPSRCAVLASASSLSEPVTPAESVPRSLASPMLAVGETTSVAMYPPQRLGYLFQHAITFLCINSFSTFIPCRT